MHAGEGARAMPGLFRRRKKDLRDGRLGGGRKASRLETGIPDATDDATDATEDTEDTEDTENETALVR